MKMTFILLPTVVLGLMIGWLLGDKIEKAQDARIRAIVSQELGK